MEDKQIGVPTNVAVFIDYENVYKALLEEKTNVLRLAFFEKLRKWCSEHQRRVVRIVVYCNFDNMDLHESFHQSVLQSYGVETVHTSNQGKNYADLKIIGAFRAGNIDDHNVVAIHLLDKYILGGQDIHAGLIGVIDDIPELLNESVRVGQIYRVQGFIRPFFHAQQDNAAVGIGEGRVGFPNAFGQTAKGFLCLNTVVLPILLDFGKVNHGFPPLRAL